MTRERKSSNIFISILAVFMLAITTLFGGVFLTGCNEQQPPAQTEVNKLVLFIGDGMSVDHIACAENYLEEGDSLNMKNLSFSGKATTAPLNAPTFPDSASGGTALATGVKVNTGSISMDADGNELETITQIAKTQGLGVGVITTDILYEATPATFSAHESSRSNFAQIRQDQYASGIDLFIGEDDADGSYLAEKAQIEEAGYSYFTDIGVNTGDYDKTKDKIFGVFSDITNSVYDAPQNNSKTMATPCLSQLTTLALEWMELHFPNGYFLMIEHNDIDINSEQKHSGGDATRYDTGPMVECLLELDRCVGIAKRTLEKTDDNFAIVVSADHATGELMESSNREGNYGFWYDWHDNDYVPYYIEARVCDLEEEIENIELFEYMKSQIVKEEENAE